MLVSDGGETAAFLADLIPTTAHLPLPWIMGYDLEPLLTLETQARVPAGAVAEEWRLVFEHDPAIASGVPVAEGKDVVLRDVVCAPAAVSARRAHRGRAGCDAGAVTPARRPQRARRVDTRTVAR